MGGEVNGGSGVGDLVDEVVAGYVVTGVEAVKIQL